MNPEKLRLYHGGVDAAEAFLNRNDLRFPTWTLDPALDLRGRYEPQLERVSVNLSNCALPVGVPGHRWSFPGYKADVTPGGVVAHETGHHVHFLLGYPAVTTDWYRKKISGYEPNWAESVAESVRLLISNPELLREGTPARWGVMTGTWGLQPVHDRPWRQVLEGQGAHPRIVVAAENWVRRTR